MNGSALVDRYLADLSSAAATLPASRRAELLDDVREHIATALEAAAPDDEVAVRNVLERLGTPAEIVAAEWAAEGGTPTAPTKSATAAPLRPPAPPAALPPAPPNRTLPAERGRRSVPVAVSGLVVIVFAAVALTYAAGPFIGAQFLFWISPAIVLLLLYEVYRGRREGGSGGRSVRPETFGLLVVLTVLGIVLVTGHYTVAAIMAILFLPVLVLLLLAAAIRGRRAGG